MFFLVAKSAATMRECVLEARESADGKSIFASMFDEVTKTSTFEKIPMSGTGVQKLLEVSGCASGATISPDMKTVVFSRVEARNKIMLVDNFR